MPLILPDVAELPRLSEHARQRAVHRVHEWITAATPNPEPMWAPVYLDTTRADWAEATRAEARRLLARMPADPLAAQHRAEST